MIRHIQPKAVPESAAPFSQVVMDDTYAHFAGLVVADFPEGQAVLGDVGEETRVVLTSIRSILEEIGLDMDRIVQTAVHLASLEDFDTMDDAFPYHDSPIKPTHRSAHTLSPSKSIVYLKRFKPPY
jgi:2-iminobutanoate/2-iminopropanoate deaminase